MKSFLTVFLACLLCASSACAQSERPLGFADILWKTKSGETKKRMLEKSGIKFVEEKSGRLTLNGGTFAGKQATYWGLDFVDDEFYRGAVILKTISDRDKEFDAVKALLIEKYGKPTTTSKKDKNVRVIWRFAPDSRNRDKEYIELWNNPREEGMKITYRNESMNAGRPEEGV
jgi:hypothetical protein